LQAQCGQKSKTHCSAPLIRFCNFNALFAFQQRMPSPSRATVARQPFAFPLRPRRARKARVTAAFRFAKAHGSSSSAGALSKI
jgi:hypothetical protein